MYRSIIINSVKSELFFGALELGLFDYLDEFASVPELHNRTGYDSRNLALCLDALASANFIDKQGDKYKNSMQAKKYLSSGSAFYVGDLILHRKKMLSVGFLADRIKYGNGKVSQKIDFERLAELTGKEMKLFRIKSFIRTAKNLLQDVSHPRFLDLGGGPGLMGIEWAKQDPQVSGLIFEQKEVAEIARKNVVENGLRSQIRVIDGNFLSDGIGYSCYDLILASGVLAFCGERLADVSKKLYHALDKGGYMIVVTPQLSENGLHPMSTVLSWLSSRLNGSEPILDGQSIHEELLKAGFKYTEDYRELLYKGAIYRKYR